MMKLKLHLNYEDGCYVLNFGKQFYDSLEELVNDLKKITIDKVVFTDDRSLVDLPCYKNLPPGMKVKLADWLEDLREFAKAESKNGPAGRSWSVLDGLSETEKQNVIDEYNKTKDKS